MRNHDGFKSHRLHYFMNPHKHWKNRKPQYLCGFLRFYICMRKCRNALKNADLQYLYVTNMSRNTFAKGSVEMAVQFLLL